MKLQVKITDDVGKVYVGEIEFSKASEGKVKPKIIVGSKGPKRLTVRTALEKLWQAGGFKEPLSFAAIKSELSESDYNFPDNTLMMGLGSVKFLTRRGTTRNYSWVQKHPHG